MLYAECIASYPAVPASSKKKRYWKRKKAGTAGYEATECTIEILYVR